MKDTLTKLEDANLEIPPHEPKKRRAKVYDPKFAELAGRLVAAGFEEKDLGYVFGCAKETIKSWKKRYPEFKDSCSEGKRREKKKLVAKALLSAVGYDYTTCKTRTIKDAEGNVTKVEETKFDNHQAANDRLLVFLLCNIDHQLGDNDWVSKQKLEIEQNKNVTLNITGEIASDQIRKIAGKLLKESPRKIVESKEIINAL